jgi:hypothetical protein
MNERMMIIKSLIDLFKTRTKMTNKTQKLFNKIATSVQLYNIDMCIEHNKKLYERLNDFVHPMTNVTFKYRVIFSYDDYDYVEDEQLIKELDQYVL